jgi:hypothetical protein
LLKAPTKPTNVVVIEKNPFGGSMPAIVIAGHRQLEKTSPEPSRQLGSSITSYNISVDLLGLFLPPAMVSDIASIEFHYRADKGEDPSE